MLKFSEQIRKCKLTNVASLVMSIIDNFCSVNNIDLEFINYSSKHNSAQEINLAVERLYFKNGFVESTISSDDICNMLNYRLLSLATTKVDESLIEITISV